MEGSSSFIGWWRYFNIARLWGFIWWHRNTFFGKRAWFHCFAIVCFLIFSYKHWTSSKPFRMILWFLYDYRARCCSPHLCLPCVHIIFLTTLTDSYRIFPTIPTSESSDSQQSSVFFSFPFLRPELFQPRSRLPTRFRVIAVPNDFRVSENASPP